MTTHRFAFPGVRLPFKGRALAASAVGAFALASGAASAETTFIGYTDGCFGAACVPTANASPQTITLDSTGLSFNDSSFNATTANGFLSIGSQGETTPAANFNNLGSFTLTAVPHVYDGTNFELKETFTAPPSILPTPSPVYTDTIIGTVFGTNMGGVFINFDNTPKNFSFGSGPTAGTFSFFVNDVSVTAGQTIGVSGTILAVSAIPEPETYALLLAGLAAMGYVARRRKTS